jgi:hypothetical protein
MSPSIASTSDRIPGDATKSGRCRAIERVLRESGVSEKSDLSEAVATVNEARRIGTGPR